MMTLEKYGFSGILLFVVFFRSSHTYIKRCPEMAELVLYSKDKCKNNHKEYHCLALHRTELNNYKEECRTPEWVSLGNYPVFRGRYIDYETCPTTSYQPFLFRSNERYKCTYMKSKCSSDGQVEVNDGKTTSNKACRCDYNRGFAFVIRPKNQCACIPSKEDCSCYLKRCEEGQYLNTDYQCTNSTVLPGQSICQVLIFTATTDIRFVVPLNRTIFSPKSIQGRNKLVAVILALVVILIAVTIFVITILFSYNHHCNEKANMPLISKDNAGNSYAKNEDNSLVTSDESEENSNSKTEDKRCVTSDDSSDIIILHSDKDNYKVVEYIGHLKALAEEFRYYDITIGSFTNVFQSTTTIQLQDVLKHCKFLFIYVSRASSKDEMHGINQEEITSVLNMHCKNTLYSSIKTVCATESSHRILKGIDLDYCSYKNDKTVRESYRNTYKQVLESLK